MDTSTSIAIFSLVVALFGGIPGGLEIYKQFKNRAQFFYSLSSLFHFQLGAGGPTAFLLTGTIANSGKTPLMPAYFLLRCRLGDKWYDFEKHLIPRELQQGTGDRIEGEPLYLKDIARHSGAIVEGIPIYGHLMFLSKEVRIETVLQYRQQKAIALTVTCVDIFGHSHPCEVALNLRRADEPKEFPQHGIAVRPEADPPRPEQ